MRTFQNPPASFNQSIRLSEEKKAAPLEALHDFFDSCPLGDIRKTLWQMVETSLAVPYSVYDKAGERQYLLWFYRQLETALEAGWLVCRQDEVLPRPGK